MTLIVWIILGMAAGWIASIIMDGRSGLFANIVIGMIGAVVGGVVLTVFGANTTGGFNSGSLITAILGAITLLVIAKGAHRPAI